MKDTNGRQVVVVTGASAGVGRAVVREFAKEGARIGLIARGRDRLESTRREVENAGVRQLCCPAMLLTAMLSNAPPRRWNMHSDRSTCGSTMP